MLGFLRSLHFFWSIPSSFSLITSPPARQGWETCSFRRVSFLTHQVTAKATVIFSTTASVGILVMSLQTLGLISLMTVEFPQHLQDLFAICKFFVLDLDDYGFSCIAGHVERDLFYLLLFKVWQALGESCHFRLTMLILTVPFGSSNLDPNWLSFLFWEIRSDVRSQIYGSQGWD